ncbi:aminotransferase class I/II-fold pyridoxal phosphate-dependent enzyme [uncultured Aureimonas sp.]|uniref:aminotransferase class I/II-fold pyridoxal phosphate-dependent enzyme n=1 Tax=uncultured Aureimonas sp. TaxID=1604662 RepID=UPI0025E167CD|nr:aminotransferase class I/II-fold pyridoxal phosphate-dependent enzyme [uncultured Aureimonas sp.]
MTSEKALTGSMRDFRVMEDTNLLDRCERFFDWQDERRRHGVWPFSRATETGPASTCGVRDDSGVLMEGVNFASQDYLGLCAHPAVRASAHAAIDEIGVHSAGSPALVGNTASSLVLERSLADFLQMDEVVLYPTGWAAGFGVIKGLVRSHDYIVMDALAHACLQTGAQAATRNVVLFRHLDNEHCRERLRTIRARDPKAGIMIVTESLFSMDSDTPDIAGLQALANEFGATLMVDVAHDLGCLGADGTGHIGMQGMLGKVDLVMGSFSKTFASNGGFVASRKRAVKEYLRFYSPSCTFSNALSPVQVAIIGQALSIVRSAEGAALRGRLMDNVLSLRRQIEERGMGVYGDPSAIVSVKTGDEKLARLTAKILPTLGLVSNLVEFPAVGKGLARFRLQVMATHSAAEVALAAQHMETGMQAARATLARGEGQRFAIAS